MIYIDSYPVNILFDFHVNFPLAKLEHSQHASDYADLFLACPKGFSPFWEWYTVGTIQTVYSAGAQT